MDKPKVLVIEDTPSIQTLLTFFFQKRGFTAIVAGDGTDAVSLVREHAPVLVMMDYIMPGKDGVEAVSDLRREGIQTPVVMLTSKAIEADRERAKAAGVNAYLLKPFNPAQLEAVIAPYLPPK